jgi:hypothetical protein
MRQRVESEPPLAVGGTLRQKSLLGHLRRARASLENAALATRPRDVTNSLKRANRRLQLFTRAVQRGLDHQRIDPTVGNELLQTAAELMTELQTLLASVPAS